MGEQSISVALCTYNGEKYVRDQLESIARQTRLPDEMVICDDMSSDNTIAIVQGFASRAGFPVRCVLNDHNLGSTKNFERAIGLCNGSIIVLSDQDDVWMPDKLERVEKLFKEAPDVGAVFSNAEMVDENSNALGYSLWKSLAFSEKEQASVANGHAMEVLLKHEVVTGAAMAFRSSFKLLVLPIPGCWVHDSWLALTIGAISGLKPIDRPLIKYRIHSGQQLGGPKEWFGAKVFRELRSIRKNRQRAFNKALSDRNIELERYTSAYDRLVECKCVNEAALNKLREKIAHIDSRINIMSRGRLPRAWLILRELVSLKYQRYSYGFYGAIKDLVI